MGCISSKETKREDREHREHVRRVNSAKKLVTSSGREEVSVVEEDVGPTGGGRGSERLTPNDEEKIEESVTILDSVEKVDESVAVSDSVGDVAGRSDTGVKGSLEEFRSNVKSELESNLRIVNVPNAFALEHVAAGWPSWLTAVAGDAVKGWLPRKADSFKRLEKIGQGTYSNVYKARDLQTGKFVALKEVRFTNMDPESVRFMAREISILRQLDHPNVIKLECLITSRMSCSLYLVFEYMEHDLAGLAGNKIKFNEPQVKCYMHQLLTGLDYCHNRGVLHRDIKGSNLLVDNNGILKIADFGLATFFNPDLIQPLTSRVVTLWYRPPELLLGATEYSVAVDMWSTGCILAELFTGKPIMRGRNEIEQLHIIFKLCGSPSEDFWRTSKLPNIASYKSQHSYPRRLGDAFKDFSSTALSLLERLLAIEPENRGTADSALKSEFFNKEPFACDPSSLPKYPPSKELAAKLREEEAKRQRSANISANGPESGRRGTKELEARPGADPDLSKARVQVTGLRNETSKVGGKNGFSHYGRSISSVRPIVQDSRIQRPYMAQGGGGGANFPNRTGFLAAKSSSIKLENQKERRQNATVPHHLLDRPSTAHKKDNLNGSKDSSAMVGIRSIRNNRIHYSGPILPRGGNVDEVLRENERLMQQAVRNARDKANAKNYTKNDPSESNSRFRPYV